MTKILVVVIFALVVLSVLSAPAEDDSGEGHKQARRHGRKCMGSNSKPSRTRLKADQECLKQYRSAKACIRLCRLEKLKVLVNGEIKTNAWRSFIGQSFPTIALEHLHPLLTACGPKYVAGTNSSSSADCSENAEFNKCVRTAVEKVCSMPLPD